MELIKTIFSSIAIVCGVILIIFTIIDAFEFVFENKIKKKRSKPYKKYICVDNFYGIEYIATRKLFSKTKFYITENNKEKAIKIQKEPIDVKDWLDNNYTQFIIKYNRVTRGSLKLQTTSLLLFTVSTI